MEKQFSMLTARKPGGSFSGRLSACPCLGLPRNSQLDVIKHRRQRAGKSTQLGLPVGDVDFVDVR